MAAAAGPPPAPPLLFPPERPLDGGELDELDCERLRPTIRALAQGLRSQWTEQGQARDDTARVWGLHGALGQGKSTVIRQVLRLLQTGDLQEAPVLPRVHGWNWIRVFTQRHGLRKSLSVKWVEASQLSPTHLNAKLISRLVLSELLLHALPMMALSASVLFMLAWAVLSLAGDPDALWERLYALVPMAASPLLLSGFALARASLKPEHEAGHLEQAIYHLACWTGAAPDLVVLDDLDRASVDQQRAVLRTLVRHTRLMRCPLVVCFDETEFLASDPNPEDPAELLRKLIQVSLRLPPRGREDATLVAWGALAVWHQRNPQRCRWAACLLHPVWVAHLARVMLVTESVGPRRAKGLVAEVISAAEAWQSGQAEAPLALDDAGALLLMAALSQLQPLARRDPDLLLACLEAGGDADALKAWSAQPRAAGLFKWLDARPREAAHFKALMRLADSMMPVVSGWRGVVLGRRTPTPKPAAGVTPAQAGLELPLLKYVLQHGQFYEGLLKLGEALDMVGRNSGGGEKLDIQLGAWLAQTLSPAAHVPEGLDRAALALMWPLLIASTGQWAEDGRQRPYAVLGRWLATWPDAQRHALHPALLQSWQREWVLDPSTDVAGAGEDDFWQAQLKTAQQGGAELTFAVLKAMRRASHKLSDESALCTWRAALHLHTAAVDPHALTMVLAHGRPIPPSGPVDDGARERRNPALHRWPAINALQGSRSAMTAALKQHMLALREWLLPLDILGNRQAVARMGAGGALDRPWSLTAWMASTQAQQLTLADCLNALAPLCWPQQGQDLWSLGHWGWFRFHAPWAMGPETLPAQCIELVALGDQDWATALCLLLQGWHGDVLVTDLSCKLWPALMQRRPRLLDARLASAVLGLWADTAATKPYSEGAGAATLCIGELALSAEAALHWFEALLTATNREDNSVSVSATAERCLKAFSYGIKTNSHAEFCTAAYDVARQQGLTPPSATIL